ncbi:Serine/threonine-protein kinase PknB [Botrimarina colliarenosi]|uniref:Serine/threonine-protein kinase PknB n=1 Tax=Botrimarina colliarenosi TaxID=2528001 RepID=A0A5C6A9J4_9BACT|nr:protein kinase [Botrimarina colliarenosi]TWT95988.1 Serine/threonine-protein kinase PknB [Botrimarina colliarenosi]
MQVPATAEDLAQSAIDVGVVTDSQLQPVWSELGSSNVALADFSQTLVRKGLVTNYQLDRLQRGLRDGYVYGDYRVLYCVGSGTFARVFRAAHRETGQIHAVKVLRSRHTGTPKADFFRREGELGKKLKHPNIVAIHDVVTRPGLSYIVMDFIEGQNLRDLYRVRKKFDWENAADIVADALAGLHYAFQQGVTHRDLKMSNVLVTAGGAGMLVDFGLAALDGVAGEDSGVDRTVEYAALEKMTGVRKDDTRSDVYFAGYILHQMLSGVSCLPEGRNRAQRYARGEAFKDIRPILELAPETPMPLAMVLSKALEMDPERRFQTPGDMLAELKLAVRRAKGAESNTTARGPEEQEGVGPDGKPRRILVVESDTKRQDVLRELFKRNGYRVLVATDGPRALSRFTGDPTAADVVVFCGASIGADAVRAFNQFGEERATAGIPTILLLEEAQGEWAASAKTADHRGVIVMPVKLRRLREAVLSAVTARESVSKA